MIQPYSYYSNKDNTQMNAQYTASLSAGRGRGGEDSDNRRRSKIMSSLRGRGNNNLMKKKPSSRSSAATFLGGACVFVFLTVTLQISIILYQSEEGRTDFESSFLSSALSTFKNPTSGKYRNNKSRNMMRTNSLGNRKATVERGNVRKDAGGKDSILSRFSGNSMQDEETTADDSEDNFADTNLQQQQRSTKVKESKEALKIRLAPSVWTVAGRNSDPKIAKMVTQQLLNATERERAMELCGTFLYSSIERHAVQVMGDYTFVATGDIDSMWTRDSAVQMGIYYGRNQQPYLRLIVQGAIRRQAFNIIQDPYANAYSKRWRDPDTLLLKQRVLGRGGWVDTRNYEADSGAYFFTQLYDYYMANVYRPEALLREPIVFDAVMLTVQTYIVEQNHETESPYRYFELPEGGKGAKTGYTGMTWSGFRPSDDSCRYGYPIPSNIHAAAGLERILELNLRIWKSEDLQQLASKLLGDIESGIQEFGIVEVPAKSGGGTEQIYAYEVDGLGHALADFDDANVPSLLSIPLLGWSGYDRFVYESTRARLLDTAINKHYYDGIAFRGMGSPHTPKKYVWPMAFAVEALTEEGSKEHIAKVLAFQVRQSLNAACGGAMHEGIHSDAGCSKYSREWFEWANALFVVLVETALGQRCDASGQATARIASAVSASSEKAQGDPSEPRFYENRFHNDHTIPAFYQGMQSNVKFVAS